MVRPAHIVRKRNLVSFLFCALERELECTQVELLQNGSPEQVKAASHALAQFQRSRPSARLVDRETGFGGSRKEELQHKEPSFLSTGQETPVSKAFLTSRLIETKDSTKDHVLLTTPKTTPQSHPKPLPGAPLQATPCAWRCRCCVSAASPPSSAHRRWRSGRATRRRRIWPIGRRHREGR